METKTFHLGDILSVTTGMLLLPNHMDGLYEILSWMAGESMSTLQLSHTAEESRPYLMGQFPWLSDIELPPSGDRKFDYAGWLKQQTVKYGEYHAVYPMHPEDHDNADDFEILVRKGFEGKIINVDFDDDEDEISPYGDIDW